MSATATGHMETAMDLSALPDVFLEGGSANGSVFMGQPSDIGIAGAQDGIYNLPPSAGRVSISSLEDLDNISLDELFSAAIMGQDQDLLPGPVFAKQETHELSMLLSPVSGTHRAPWLRCQSRWRQAGSRSAMGVGCAT